MNDLRLWWISAAVGLQPRGRCIGVSLMNFRRGIDWCFSLNVTTYMLLSRRFLTLTSLICLHYWSINATSHISLSFQCAVLLLLWERCEVLWWCLFLSVCLSVCPLATELDRRSQKNAFVDHNERKDQWICIALYCIHPTVNKSISPDNSWMTGRQNHKNATAAPDDAARSQKRCIFSFCLKVFSTEGLREPVGFDAHDGL